MNGQPVISVARDSGCYEATAIDISDVLAWWLDNEFPRPLNWERLLFEKAVGGRWRDETMCGSIGCNRIGDVWKSLRNPGPCSDGGTAAHRVNTHVLTGETQEGRALDEVFLTLVRQHLQRLLVRLGYQHRREHAGEHEEAEDFEAVNNTTSPSAGRISTRAASSPPLFNTETNVHMGQEATISADVLQPLERELGDDGAQLPTRCGNSMRCRAVARGERLSRNDECRRVRSEVLEEVCQAI